MPIVDPEFKSLIPPPSPEEYAILSESIRNEGCRDAISLWGEIIVDGHNRFALCEEHGVAFKTRSMKFADRDAAKLWMLRNQIGRRNLTPSQLAMLAAKVATIRVGENQHTKEGASREAPSTEATTDNELTNSESEKRSKSQDAAAKEFGVSRSSVQRAATVQRDAEPELIAAVEAGKVAVKSAEKLAKEKPSVQRKVAAAADPAKAAKKALAPKVEPLDAEGCSDPVEPWKEVSAATDVIISELKAVATHMRKAYKIEGEQVTHPGAIKYTRSATVGQVLEIIRYLENFKPVAKTSKGIITALDRQKEAALRKGTA